MCPPVRIYFIYTQINILSLHRRTIEEKEHKVDKNKKYKPLADSFTAKSLKLEDNLNIFFP